MRLVTLRGANLFDDLRQWARLRASVWIESPRIPVGVVMRFSGKAFQKMFTPWS
jgi:hypothetical protein